MHYRSRPLLARALAVALVSSAAGSCTTVEREIGDRLDDEHDPSPWTSAKACDELTPRTQSTTRPPRIGTWNILYFPDADEEQQDEEDGTDVSWLACAISGLEVDILAVQEIKLTERSEKKQEELIERLNERTGGDWRMELAGCKPDRVQHPGFLYDASRVTGAQFRELPQLSPDDECSNRVSPGFAAYFTVAGGPDFHLVAVHMEAYPEKRSLESRERSVAVMGDVAKEAYELVPDTDIIFAGDFNTTGCDECSPAVSAEEETLRLRTSLIQSDPGMDLVPADLTCSKPGGPLMDHFAANMDLSELPAASIARVRGICEETMCSRFREWHERATERLSDHCPLTLDLAALDDD